jgi:hypothetical protein
MKKTWILSFAFFQISCTGMKHYFNEKIENIPNKKWYFINEEMTQLKANINGQEYVFDLDLGAQKSMLNEELINVDSSKLFKKNFKGIDKTTKSQKGILYPVDLFEAPIFIAKKQLIGYKKPISNATTTCFQHDNFNIIGANFIEGSYPLLLNYKEGYIAFIDENEISKYAYVPIKCTFAALNEHIYIYMRINGEEIKFLFDSGNFSGTIFISDKVDVHSKPYSTIDYTVYDINENNKIQTFNAYQNQDAQLGQNGDLKLKINFATSNAIGNNVGLTFIRDFNWIIDRKHKKIYCQLNNKTLLQSRENTNLANQTPGLQKGNIIVDAVRKGASKYQCGDTIVSVQNTKVNAENICSIYQILASSNNWDTLNVVVQAMK